MNVLVVVAPGQGSQTPGFLAPWLDVPGVKDRLEWLSAVAGIDLVAHGTTSDADTIRDTAIAQPLRLRECLAALRATKGGAILLTEAEIATATLDLARIGIYVEPTCAQAAAACARLLEAGTIAAEQTTVLVMTGTGLKATPRIAEMLGIAL